MPRRPALRHAVLDDARTLDAEHGPDSLHPITLRQIRAGGVPIGELIHRDYRSGYPGPFEVSMTGGRSWSFHDTDGEAHRGVEQYALAFLAPGPHRRGTGFYDLEHLVSPVDRAALAATPSLLRPWPTGPVGRQRIARELRAALIAPGVDEVDLRRVVGAVADYLASD